MPDAQTLLVEHMDGVLESIKDAESAQADVFDPLEVKVKASWPEGQLREIYLVLTTGGPHIEMRLYDGYLDGYWSGAERSYPIESDHLDTLADYYESGWTRQ